MLFRSALEGLRREDSVHAAGVVIGDAPLVNYLPLKLSKDSRDDSRRIVTQFDMHGVEKLGLLKMDFLGLRNLTVLDDCLGHIQANRLRSALLRTESRGCHYREDFPYRDDANWLCWILIRRGENGMVLEREPVPQAWQPDASVPYEKRYDWRLPGEEGWLRGELTPDAPGPRNNSSSTGATE